MTVIGLEPTLFLEMSFGPTASTYSAKRNMDTTGIEPISYVCKTYILPFNYASMFPFNYAPMCLGPPNWN